MNKRPNILFITSDQHNAKVLSCKGHPDVKTPNLDKLAGEGVRFDNAITQNPICTPSRVTWMSGQYCHNHGYYGLCGPNPNGLPTLLGHFRQNGYKTAAIGKIHCPEYWIEDDCDMFIETRNCSIGGSQEYEKTLREKGLLEEYSNEGQTFDGHPSALKFEDGVEAYDIARTKDFIESVISENKPFFVHLSFNKPHSPYWPCKEFWEMYDEDKLTLPPNFNYEMKNKAPNLVKTLKGFKEGGWTKFEPRTYEAGSLRKLHGYLGCVSQLDYAIGQMVDWIDGKGLGEDTIIIYLSDHGDYACEHGIIEKAPGICSDAITRVPWIWRWPGHFKAGHTAQEIVEAVDMATTLCRLVGVDDFETGDGKNISDMLQGHNNNVHKIGVTEFAWSKSVRKGNYRFVYYPQEMFAEEYPYGFGELYNLSTDPWEMHNLYFEKDYAGVIEELKNDLLEWLITTARPKTIHLPKQDSGYQGITRYGNTVNYDGKIHTDVIRTTLNKNYI